MSLPAWHRGTESARSDAFIEVSAPTSVWTAKELACFLTPQIANVSMQKCWPTFGRDASASDGLNA